MAGLADTVLGNQDLMQAIKDVISAIFPLVNVLLQSLVPAFTGLVKVVLALWNTIKPVVSLILGLLLPAFDKVIIIAQMVANSFLIIKNAMTGNISEVKRLRDENQNLSKSLAASPWYKVVNLDAGDFDKAEKVGAKIHQSMEKGAEKEAKKSSGSAFKDLLPKRTFGVSNTATQQNVGPTPITASMVKIPEAAKQVQDKVSQQQQDFYDEQKANADAFLDDVGDIFSNRFTQIFSGDVLGGLRGFFSDSISFVSDGFRDFAMNWIKQSTAAFLKTFSFQAKIYTFYGKIMSGLAKLLGNPFTAGIAALGIAAGLSALSRTLGGSGGSSANAGTGFNPNIGAENTQNRIGTMNNTGNITINFPEGLVDLSNPTTQRQFTKLINDVASNRSLNLVGA
jgi:hypothetical protein